MITPAIPASVPQPAKAGVFVVLPTNHSERSPLLSKFERGLVSLRQWVRNHHSLKNVVAQCLLSLTFYAHAGIDSLMFIPLGPGNNGLNRGLA